MDSVETIERNGYVARIERDEDPSSPREWDNVGVVVDFSRRYTIGDRKGTDTEAEALRRGGFKLLERYLRMTEGATVVLPLYLFDHSGLSLSTDSSGFRAVDSAGWDWGLVGFIYDTRATRKNIGTEPEHVRECLLGEVETLAQFIEGDVYGYVIEDSEGAEVESCWGFFGLSYVREEVNAILDSLPHTIPMPLEA